MARSKEVDAWFDRYENPVKDVVLRMREIVLGADPRVEECIKWQAPTFTFLGNIASFYPKSKQHASLMFHQGALIPGRHPRLEGSGDTSRVLKIGSVAEANAAKSELEAIVRAWCAMREQGSAPAREPENKARKPTRPGAKTLRGHKRRASSNT